MHTKRFGEINLEHGEADLPAPPPQKTPIFLHLSGIMGSPDLLEKVADFLDALPVHIAAAKAAFMADAEDLSFIAQFIFADLPQTAKTLFPNATTPQDVTRDDLWAAFGIRSIWSGDDQYITIDFAFRDAEIDHVFAGYFDYEGKLVSLSMES